MFRMAPAEEQGPHQAEVIVASIEEIFAKANTLTAPTFDLTSGLVNPEESLLRQYCLSKFKSAWRSRISSLASILRSYLTELEATKCHGPTDLLGPRLGQTKNNIRLKEQIEHEYRKFLESITSLDQSIFNPAGTGEPSSVATRAENTKRRQYWSSIQCELHTRLDAWMNR